MSRIPQGYNPCFGDGDKEEHELFTEKSSAHPERSTSARTPRASKQRKGTAAQWERYANHSQVLIAHFLAVEVEAQELLAVFVGV